MEDGWNGMTSHPVGVFGIHSVELATVRNSEDYFIPGLESHEMLAMDF